MAEIKPFHEYYYGFAVMRLNVSSTDFWRLTPHEFWLLHKEFCIINGIEDKEPEIKWVERLTELFDLPEARPSKAIKVKHGN